MLPAAPPKPAETCAIILIIFLHHKKKTLLYYNFFFINLLYSFVSLNVKGLGHNIKRKAVFLFCKGIKTHYTLLQETHSCDCDATFWSNQWGEKILFSHGTNHSLEQLCVLIDVQEQH